MVAYFKKNKACLSQTKKIFDLVKLPVYILDQCHQGHITLILLYTSQVSFFSLRNLSSNFLFTNGMLQFNGINK